MRCGSAYPPVPEPKPPGARRLCAIGGIRSSQASGLPTAKRRQGDYAFAINRARYALFYAVSALLLEEGHRFNKHSGVRAAFSRYLIKVGRLSEEDGDLYNQLFRDRQEGDYIEFADLMPHMCKRRSMLVRNFLTFPISEFGLFSCGFLVHPL